MFIIDSLFLIDDRSQIRFYFIKYNSYVTCQNLLSIKIEN